jgi:hypothetical protein
LTNTILVDKRDIVLEKVSPLLEGDTGSKGVFYVCIHWHGYNIEVRKRNSKLEILGSACARYVQILSSPNKGK